MAKGAGKFGDGALHRRPFEARKCRSNGQLVAVGGLPETEKGQVHLTSYDVVASASFDGTRAEQSSSQGGE